MNPYTPEHTAPDTRLIERNFALAANASDKAEIILWTRSYYCWRLVRLYEYEGAYQRLAIELNKDVSQIANYVFAFDLYRALRTGVAPEMARLAHSARQVFTHTHFVNLAAMARKYNLNKDDCFYWLEEYLLNRKKQNEGLDTESYPSSASALKRDIEARYEVDGRVATWDWYIKQMAGLVVSVQVAKHCPDEIREWARTGANLFEKYKGKGGARQGKEPSAMTKKKG